MGRKHATDDRVDVLARAQNAYNDTMKKIEAVKEEADVEVLKRVQIIGTQKIASVAPPVVICEEAGEVSTRGSAHGMPHDSSYSLATTSNCGIGLVHEKYIFVNPKKWGGVSCVSRASRLLDRRACATTAISVGAYDVAPSTSRTVVQNSMPPTTQRVTRQAHNHAAGGAHGATRYHSNEYEVEYLVGTLRYLLKQGYHASYIAILTPYVGQLMKLRSALRGQFILELNELDLKEIQRTFDDDDEDDDTEEIRHDSSAALGATKKELSGAIRAATIDNFQGEEATVILTSLVRSSTNVHGRGTIGFLKTPNRINVLLSRAKHGLILVGHGELLRAKSPLWQKVLDQLQSDGCYGDGLPLHCQQHPEYQRVATNPSSFALLAPDGGCLRPCGRRLPRCGHACPKLCHVDQPSHKAVYCTQPCPRLQEGCGHVCPGVCGDACGRCEVLVGSIVLPCGHTYRNARCFEAKMPSKLKCKAPVDKFVPECGHMQRVTCSTTKIKCAEKCGAVLPCGHPCSRKCSECVDNTLKAREGEPEPDFPIKPTEHGACQKECERLLPCCHRCRGICHGTAPCPPCQRICDVFSCEHGSCNHPCSDPCAACTERCSWSCEHCGECPLPCGAPCNRRLCDRRCTKSLTCGHQCPSVCGEDCPSQEFCHICGDDNVKQRVADVILFQTYGEIDPSEDPVLVLPCCSMCPNCKKPIRGLRRYGRVTKRAAIDAAENKFITHAQHQLAAMQGRVQAAERGDLTLDKSVYDELRAFGSMVNKPPCQKLFKACVALLTKAKGGQGGGDIDNDLSTLPVPNSNFRFEGYYNMFSAQLRLLGANSSATTAENEAKLVLVQVLLTRAEKVLGMAVKTEEGRKKREKKVEKLTSEVNDLFAVFGNECYNFLPGTLPRSANAPTKEGGHCSASPKRHVLPERIHRGDESDQNSDANGVSWLRSLVPMRQWPLVLDWECGMAMEQNRCPECGAPVGGANHSFVKGNVHDVRVDSL
ncbi:P-loop containing nucleoside triphosphate hydrolase [Phytophthora cactorum]|nr:P-loop containing nucleoside triphosphate hydrolase [Phytophthora cactorum]KAF1773749.1 P-loop containing nucleoside triphosphate hydrolase [Phytophthora cactorum]